MGPWKPEKEMMDKWHIFQQNISQQLE